MKKMLYKLVGLITLISILTSLVPLSIFATSEVETVSSVSEKSAVGPVKAVTIFNKSMKHPGRNATPISISVAVN